MNHAERLAVAPDDPVWSRPMENQLIAEFTQAGDLSINQLQVECRAALCGVVYTFSESIGNDDLLPVYEHVESQLGLQHAGTGFGMSGDVFFRAEYFRVDTEN